MAEAMAADTDTSFDHAYRRWMEEHFRAAKGEGKRKLLDGLSFAEHLFVRQWWEAFGNFDHLHPQYEIRDFKDGVRFIDFAYIYAGVRLCIEIDPFGTHVRNLTRWEYDDGLDRHNDLVLDRMESASILTRPVKGKAPQMPAKAAAMPRQMGSRPRSVASAESDRSGDREPA